MLIAQATTLAADPILADAVSVAMLEEQRRIADATITAARTDLIQLMISLGTILGLFFTLYLTRRSVALTAQSLEMAEAQQRAQQRVTLEEQRAYLALDEVSFSNVDYDRKPRISLTWKNFGKTAALDVRIRTALRFQRAMDAPGADPGPLYGTVTVVPGAKMGSKAEATAPLEMEDLEALVRETGCLVAWGEVHYRDVFGNARLIRFAEAFTGDGPSNRILLEGGNAST